MSNHKRIIVAVHGIKTKSLNWTDVFRVYVKKDKRFNDYIYVEHYWGYIPAWLCVMPFVRGIKSKGLLKKIRSLKKKYKTLDISVICHSYGTLMTYDCVKRWGEFLDKVVMIGGVVPVEAPIKSLLKSRMTMLFNYYSPNDKVSRLAPFGSSGAYGFNQDHPRLKQLEYHVEHSDWFSEEGINFYDMWLNDLSEVEE